MPITNVKPVVAPVPDDTILGQEIIFALLPTGGSQLNFRFKSASLATAIQKLKRLVADTDGALIPDRTVITQKERTWRGTADEFGADFVTAFVNATKQVGTGRIWIRDPEDAAGTVSWMSNEFSLLAHLEGEISFSQGAFAEAQLTIEVNGAFSINRNASIV